MLQRHQRLQHACTQLNTRSSRTEALWVKSPAADGYATVLLQAVESSLKLETTNVFKIPFAVNKTQIGMVLQRIKNRY
jgi:hypothetical protein